MRTLRSVLGVLAVITLVWLVPETANAGWKLATIAVKGMVCAY